MPSKKNYQVPSLTRHGDVKSVTQKGGSGFVDVPVGTAVAGNVSNVAS